MTKVRNFKEVPSFEGNYAQFEREVNLWSTVSKLRDEEKGAALALSLKGTARQIATNLPTADLNAATGLANVLAAVKTLFEKDSMDSKYKALKEVEQYVRKPEENVMDFIVEFELRYNKARDISGEAIYSDAMKAFKLIVCSD